MARAPTERATRIAKSLLQMDRAITTISGPSDYRKHLTLLLIAAYEDTSETVRPGIKGEINGVEDTLSE